MTSNSTHKCVSSLFCALATLAIGVGPAVAKTSRTAARLAEARAEFAATQQETIDLGAELHRVAVEMVPLEREVEVLLARLNRAKTKKQYIQIREELRKVGNEWSELRYQQVNMIQEFEYLTRIGNELQVEIQRLEAQVQTEIASR